MKILTTTLEILYFCNKVKGMDFNREELRSYIDNHFFEVTKWQTQILSLRLNK